MIIGIDMGHTLDGANSGTIALGKREQDLTRQVGNILIKKLKKLGHTIVDCTQDYAESNNDSLSKRVQIANSNNVDIFICIHFNAFNGSANGTEIYIYAKEGDIYEKALDVCEVFNDNGFHNRGIKDINDSNLFVIRKTKAPAMLIECCFMDNVNDMNKYNPNSFADWIVQGIFHKSDIIVNEPLKTYENGDYDCKGKIVRTKGTGLNVRSSRNSDSDENIIGNIPEGTIIEVNYCKNNWFSTWSFENKEGYIYGGYIDLI